jgi:hypothetical protein
MCSKPVGARQLGTIWNADSADLRRWPRIDSVSYREIRGFRGNLPTRFLPGAQTRRDANSRQSLEPISASEQHAVLFSAGRELYDVHLIVEHVAQNRIATTSLVRDLRGCPLEANPAKVGRATRTACQSHRMRRRVDANFGQRRMKWMRGARCRRTDETRGKDHCGRKPDHAHRR